MKRVVVPATDKRKGELSIASDPRWQMLKNASAAEIDAYLAANVQTVEQVRPILRSLLLTMRYLLSRQPT